MVAFATDAHAPVPSRSLRLQLSDGRLQGLVEFHLPAQGARVYSAAPDLALASTPAALAGLRFEVDGAFRQAKVARASAARTAEGAVNTRLLLEVGPVAKSLRVFVEAEPPLPITLVAQTGLKLRLDSGPGAPIAGGLALRPRPGVPCAVSIRRR
jgi:hypothetical protein